MKGGDADAGVLVQMPQMRIPTDAENPAGYESRELPRILQEM